MLLDIVLGSLVLGSTLWAARKGLTKELFRIVALVLGLLAAMWGYSLVAALLVYLIPNAMVASTVAFALIFIAFQFAGAVLAQILSAMWSIVGLGMLDTILGAAFGALRGLLLAAVILLVLVAFQPFSSTGDLLADSAIAPAVLKLARTAAAVAPEALREAFQDGMQQIWESLKSDPPADSETSSRALPSLGLA